MRGSRGAGRLNYLRARLKPGHWTRRQDAALYGRRDVRRRQGYGGQARRYRKAGPSPLWQLKPIGAYKVQDMSPHSKSRGWGGSVPSPDAFARRRGRRSAPSFRKRGFGLWALGFGAAAEVTRRGRFKNERKPGRGRVVPAFSTLSNKRWGRAVPTWGSEGGRDGVGRPSGVVRFRRLTLRSATGTAQRTVPTWGPAGGRMWWVVRRAWFGSVAWRYARRRGRRSALSLPGGRRAAGCGGWCVGRGSVPSPDATLGDGDGAARRLFGKEALGQQPR